MTWPLENPPFSTILFGFWWEKWIKFDYFFLHFSIWFHSDLKSEVSAPNNNNNNHNNRENRTNYESQIKISWSKWGYFHQGLPQPCIKCWIFIHNSIHHRYPSSNSLISVSLNRQITFERPLWSSNRRLKRKKRNENISWDCLAMTCRIPHVLYILSHTNG